MKIPVSSSIQGYLLTYMTRFVLKTKEQRAAEKALMDKSPLNTLTLEDFLESERHKLTGSLTPVTPESFAKWKQERQDKKAAEAEALKAKEATGRAMFEAGDWEDSEEDSDEDDDRAVWNLETMRAETERIRREKEEQRLAIENGEPLGNSDSTYGSDDDRGPRSDDDDNGGEGSSGQSS